MKNPVPRSLAVIRYSFSGDLIVCVISVVSFSGRWVVDGLSAGGADVRSIRTELEISVGAKVEDVVESSSISIISMIVIISLSLNSSAILVLF